MPDYFKKLKIFFDARVIFRRIFHLFSEGEKFVRGNCDERTESEDGDIMRKSGLIWRCAGNYKAIFCTLCAFLNLACQSSPATSSSNATPGNPRLIKSDESSLKNKSLQNDLHCDNFADRIDELKSLILRQEQTAKQASEQAAESCGGDSAVDCGFWTERAADLAKQVRELRQEQLKLINQKSQNGCS